MYIPQTINMRLGNKVMEKSPVYVVVDTVKNVLSPFPIKFPPIMSSDDVTKPSLGNELSYSCCLMTRINLYSLSFLMKIFT